MKHESSIDAVLGVIARSGGPEGPRVEVTLLVGGVWISGMLTSAGEWFRRLDDVVQEQCKLGWQQRSFGDLGEYHFACKTDENNADIQAADEDEPREQGYPDFIHLIDASPPEAPHDVLSTCDGLIRIRLSAVDGWSFGRSGAAPRLPDIAPASVIVPAREEEEYLPDEGLHGNSLLVWLDQDACDGDGSCSAIAPEVFFTRSGTSYVQETAANFGTEKKFDGKAYPAGINGKAWVPAGGFPKVLQACEHCPSGAITIEPV